MKKVSTVIISIFIFFAFSTVNVFANDADLLKIGVSGEPDSLSPLISYERFSYEVFMLIYDSLITFDENMNPAPSLAKNWEVSDDNLTWTFYLRDDVKWTDGEKFTSKDVKFTFELFRDSGLGMYSGIVEDIKEIETPDDYTVILKTELPKANMLQNITPIIPEHIWKDVPEDDYEIFDNENPIGTGPFILKEWKKNEYVSFVANKDYFKGSPKISKLIYVIYANRDTMAQSIKLGEIDAALGLYKAQLNTIEDDKNISLYDFSENGFTEIAFNCRSDGKSKGNPLILDKKIRQAIEYAMDKQKIIDMVYEGEGVPGTTMIPVSQNLYHYIPNAEELRYFSPEKAKEILENADYKDRDGDGIRESKKGEKLIFKFLLRSDNVMEIKAGQMIKGYLKDVGIETKIETLDNGALTDRIYDNSDFDMFIWGWGGDVDPSTLLRVLTTNQIDNLNDSFYSNPEYDKIVDEQASIMDFDERQKTVYEAQKILYEDLPYIILMYEKELQLIRKDRLEGLKPTVNGAIFYADTPFNYLNVSTVEAQTIEEKEAPEKKTPSYVPYAIGGVTFFGVIAMVLKKRKKSKEEWQ